MALHSRLSDDRGWLTLDEWQPDNEHRDEMRPAPFYSTDLNTQTYDLGVGRGGPGTDVDVPFYRDLAAASGPRVLELGCGTGRVTIALAQAGLEATGLDRSPGMLREAASKLARLDHATAARLSFVQGDMTDFALRATFDSVQVPARGFAFLLTQKPNARVWSESSSTFVRRASCRSTCSTRDSTSACLGSRAVAPRRPQTLRPAE
jgi:SAM-dependent methyltransferase